MVVLPPRFLLFYPIQNDHWCPWLVTVKPLPQSCSQTFNAQSLTHFISIYFAINVKKIYICKQIHWILSSILIIPQFIIYFLNTRILANTSLWSKQLETERVSFTHVHLHFIWKDIVHSLWIQQSTINSLLWINLICLPQIK